MLGARNAGRTSLAAGGFRGMTNAGTHRLIPARNVGHPLLRGFYRITPLRFSSARHAITAARFSASPS